MINMVFMIKKEEIPNLTIFDKVHLIIFGWVLKKGLYYMDCSIHGLVRAIYNINNNGEYIECVECKKIRLKH